MQSLGGAGWVADTHCNKAISMCVLANSELNNEATVATREIVLFSTGECIVIPCETGISKAVILEQRGKRRQCVNRLLTPTSH